MYERIREEFPHKEQRLIQEVDITQRPQAIQQQMRTSERILFFTNDRKTFIQVGPHLLAINCLKPYPTWKGFKPRIITAFKALTDTVDVKALARIGVRYINRVELPTGSINLDDYFEFRLHLGQKLPQNMTSFIVGCVLPFLDERDCCRAQLTNAVPESPEGIAFLLDFDYYLARSQAVPPQKALEWVEAAHQKVEEIFEGCISDRLRIIFQEIQ